MAKFGLMIKESDGYLFNSWGYRENEEPPASAVPDGGKICLDH